MEGTARVSSIVIVDALIQHPSYGLMFKLLRGRGGGIAVSLDLNRVTIYLSAAARMSYTYVLDLIPGCNAPSGFHRKIQ